MCVCVCVQRGLNQPPLAKIKELRLKKEYRQANRNSYRENLTTVYQPLVFRFVIFR